MAGSINSLTHAYGGPGEGQREQAARLEQQRRDKEVRESSLSELRAIKAPLERSLGITAESDDGDDDAWVQAELAKANRYQLFLASRNGVAMRSEREARAVKLMQVELEMMHRPITRLAVK